MSSVHLRKRDHINAFSLKIPMRKYFSFLDRCIQLLTKWSFGAAALATLAIMVIGSLDVLGTYFLNEAVPSALELQEVLLAVSIFLGFAHVQSRNEQISVDIFVSKLSRRVRRPLYLLMLAFCAGTFAIIAWRSWALAASSWNLREAARALFAFPIYPAKFLVSFGAAVAALECIRQIGWWFMGEDFPTAHGSADSSI